MGKSSGKQKYTWILLIGALAVYFFMRFFFTITLPFLLAFLVVWKVYPFLNKLSKKTRLKETWILGAFIFLTVFLVIAILAAPLSNCFGDEALLLEDESILESKLLETCAEKYRDFKKTCSEYMGEDIVVTIQSGAMNGAKTCFTVITYVAIFLVSLILFCKDFSKIREKIEERENNTLLQVIRGVVSYVKAFLKTQVIIFIVIVTLSVITLTILGVPNGWLFGLLAGTLDTFPFLGTGIVLGPLAAWLFLKGQMWQGFFCLLLYGVCALLRELLEPKLVGEKVGIYPIVLFASVFIGMHIYGVGGIIKGPLSVVIIYELRKVLLAKENEV